MELLFFHKLLYICNPISQILNYSNYKFCQTNYLDFKIYNQLKRLENLSLWQRLNFFFVNRFQTSKNTEIKKGALSKKGQIIIFIALRECKHNFRQTLIDKFVIFLIKGSDRLCKVVELSMQCCGILLSDSFEKY